MRRTAWVVVVGLAVGCFRFDPPPVTGEPPAQEPDETLVVYSLEPGRLETDDKLGPGEAEFHRYLVIGSTTVTDAKVRQEVLSAVRKGIDEEEQDPTVHKMCMFSPRHGVRHVAKEGTETDWLICFSCGQVAVFENGQPLKNWETEDRFNGRRKTNGANITHRPQKLLNDTLRTAGVKLAPGADKGE